MDWEEVERVIREGRVKGINPFSLFNTYQREMMLAYLTLHTDVVPPEQGNFPAEDGPYFDPVGPIAFPDTPPDHYPTLAERLAESMKDDKHP